MGKKSEVGIKEGTRGRNQTGKGGGLILGTKRAPAVVTRRNSKKKNMKAPAHWSLQTSKHGSARFLGMKQKADNDWRKARGNGGGRERKISRIIGYGKKGPPRGRKHIQGQQGPSGCGERGREGWGKKKKRNSLLLRLPEREKKEAEKKNQLSTGCSSEPLIETRFT